MASFPERPDPESAIVYAGPDTGATQGYATDGVHHYLFSTAAIQQTDAQWLSMYSNSDPFAGLPSGVNHIGDGAYYNGKLYAPVEHYSGCGKVKHATIAVYTAHTPNLPLSRYADVSADEHEISSIAVVPAKNALYLSSFCEPAHLSIYDLATLAKRATLALSANIAKIQGISWNPARNRFVVTADSEDEKTGYLYFISPEGRVAGPVYTVPQTGELEGVDSTRDTIRYLINGSVYFLDPQALAVGPNQ